jgi:hypothetical protein
MFTLLRMKQKQKNGVQSKERGMFFILNRRAVSTTTTTTTTVLFNLFSRRVRDHLALH